MKKTFTLLFLGRGIFCSLRAGASNPWQQVDAAKAPKQLQWQHPSRFLVYTLDEAPLKLQMWNLSENPAEGTIVQLPLPDGSYRDFKVWQTPMMPDVLAAKYPSIKTFTGEAVDDHFVTAKLEFTCYGFSAM